MSPLLNFYNNEVEREAVKEFLILTLRELAADRALDGESTEGIQEAGECVEKAFDRLEELYSKPKPIEAQNSR